VSLVTPDKKNPSEFKYNSSLSSRLPLIINTKMRRALEILLVVVFYLSLFSVTTAKLSPPPANLDKLLLNQFETLSAQLAIDLKLPLTLPPM
jgi:hypothetical protein